MFAIKENIMKRPVYNSFRKFPEFAGIIYSNGYCAPKKCTLTSFVALGMQSKRNDQKNGEPTIRFSLTTLLQHTGRLWSRFFSPKNNVTILGDSPRPPDMDRADFYLFPRLESALKVLRFCDATDINKNATEELKRILLF